MKTILTTAVFLAFATSGVQARTVKNLSSLSLLKEDCTKTVTQYRTATVECPDGAFILVTASSSSTVTAVDCPTATAAATAAAGYAAQESVDRLVKTKDFICD